MPKNPVRAARQSGRQEVRAAKQTSKVAKIQSKTQTKLAKIQGRSGTPAAAATTAPKFKTAAELKSTIKMPDFKARAVEMAKEKAKANGTGSKAPVAKSTPKSSPSKTPAPKAKTPAPAPAPVKKQEETGPYVISKGYDNAVKKAKENAKGAYLTLPQYRNKDQQIQVKMDKKKEVRKQLQSFMPNGKKAMGGGIKGKKC